MASSAFIPAPGPDRSNCSALYAGVLRLGIGSSSPMPGHSRWRSRMVKNNRKSVVAVTSRSEFFRFHSGEKAALSLIQNE